MKSLWIVLGVVAAAALMGVAYLAGGAGAGKAALGGGADTMAAPTRPTMTTTLPPKPAPGGLRKDAAQGVQSRKFTPMNADEQAAAIAQGELINSLFEAGAEGTPEHMEKVYGALNHTDPEVREAAADVLMQYAGKEAVPRLRAAQAAATSAEEKARLEEAIEFVQLPSLSDLRAGETSAPRGEGSKGAGR